MLLDLGVAVFCICMAAHSGAPTWSFYMAGVVTSVTFLGLSALRVR